MHVELTLEAAAELEEATDWYVRRGGDRGKLARRFLDEVRRGVALIAEQPKLHAEIEPGIRHLALRGFPYKLIYAVEPDRALVLAVMHCKRRPGYWRDRDSR